jgi:hypothetical protein
MGSELTTNTEDLDQQIAEATKALSRKQRKFVEIYASGDNSGTAAIKAGYAPGSSHVHASRMLNQDKYAHVQRAVALMRDKYSLEHGFSAAWKRHQLKDTYEHARRIDQPSAANQTMRTMLEMDGDIRQAGAAGSGSVVININTGIERGEIEVNDPPLPIEGSDTEDNKLLIQCDRIV